jgi:hypothetical protein
MTLEPARKAEAQRLAELEVVIERGLQTFVEVGNALAEVRDKRLYRQTHRTFELYCRERWGFSRQHAYRQMYAARLVSMSPTGDIPATERQARALLAARRQPIADDAKEFGAHMRHGGWRRAMLVACCVQASEEAGARSVGKVSAQEFARRAGTSAARVLRDLEAWERAAADGHVPSAANLTPEQDVELPDDPDSELWEQYYGGEPPVEPEPPAPNYGRYKVHPFLEENFPLLGPKEFELFVQSVRQLGLVELIVLAPDGETIVDGRIRYLACQRAGVEPKFRTLGVHYTEDLIRGFIMSANGLRQHLGADDLRAMLRQPRPEGMSKAEFDLFRRSVAEKLDATVADGLADEAG